MNKTRKQIEQLQNKINPLKEKIYELEHTETIKVQLPRLTKMIGFCLCSTYESKNYYGKILDLVEEKDKSPQFILEVCHITKEGNPYLHLDCVSPYLNKEWWDVEIPMSGWKKCSEEEYQIFKAKILSEFSSQKSLRKWIKNI